MRQMMFSSMFPVSHPMKGEPTFFKDKIRANLPEYQTALYEEWGEVIKPKLHTIRAGNKWPDGKLVEVGDEFMPKVWKGRPYFSKTDEICKALKITYLYEFRVIPKSGLFILNPVGHLDFDKCFTEESLREVANNDGLTLKQFKDWFKKPFTGLLRGFSDVDPYNTWFNG